MNEASGSLTGLTRVRRFQQDDGHIIARPDQLKSEVVNCLSFLRYIYSIFGFSATFALSTRPKKAMGAKELWDHAEEQLRLALDESGIEWSLNPGDGAFYGPKIDIRLMDAMKRKFQCGTIQLDFQNPIRFNLQYRREGAEEADDAADDKEEFSGAVEKNDQGEVIWREGRLKAGFERPVVIHRAILGSVERMSAVLIEHYGGKWPFWLSPRQVMVVPVGEKFNEYATWVCRQLTLYGFYAEVETSGKTLNKKVRESQIAAWNYVAVVGDKEMGDLTVNLRQRDVDKPLGIFTMPEFITKLDSEGMPTSQPLRKFEAFEGRLPMELVDSATPAVAATGKVEQSASPKAKPAPSPTKTDNVPSAKTDKAPPATKKQCNQKDGDVEAFLEHRPYVGGFAATRADNELFTKLCGSGFPETPNLRRWFEHMQSFSPAERAMWSCMDRSPACNKWGLIR